MGTERTFDDVIEEHRQAVGAERVSVTLGPAATPEGLARELEKTRRKTAAYESFSELEREQAKVARLRGVMRSALRHSQRRLDATADEMSAKLSAIFGELDLVPDVSLEADTAWMVEQREGRGQPLPPELGALLAS